MNVCVRDIARAFTKDPNYTKGRNREFDMHCMRVLRAIDYLGLEKFQQRAKSDNPKIVNKKSWHVSQEAADKIRYYLNQEFCNNRVEHNNHKSSIKTLGVGNQWVYVAHWIEGNYKIGKSLTPEFRVAHLGTGHANDPTIDLLIRCSDATKLEKKLHCLLDDYRINAKREFFNCDLIKIEHAYNILLEL